MWDDINRRRFPRADYQCIITIKSKGEIPKIITTHTENIGLGGICVILKEDFNLFRNVELEILLEDSSQPLRCSGSVVWVVKKSDPANKRAITFDTGIEFLNIKEVDKVRIEKIVDQIMSSS